VSDSINTAVRELEPHECAPPYILYVGAAKSLTEMKTATGLMKWRPEWCVGYVAEEGFACHDEMNGLPHLTIGSRSAIGKARTFVVCCSTVGSRVHESWVQTICDWLYSTTLDVASGSHQRLEEVAPIRDMAVRHGRRLVNFRHHDVKYPPFRGEPRKSGRCLLTVGHDGVVGKKYTSLSIVAGMARRGLAGAFCPTGQTGALIAGSGSRSIVIDSVAADYASSAAAWLTPDTNDPDFWYVVEGQASLFHPAWGPDSLALIHGARPDALVFCVDAKRTKMMSTDLPLVDAHVDVHANMTFANARKHCALVGVSVNMSGYGKYDRDDFLFVADKIREHLKPYYWVNCFDPNVEEDVDEIVARMKRITREG